MNPETFGYPQPHLMQVIASESFGNDFFDKLGKVIEARQQTDEQQSDEETDPLDITREDIQKALEVTLKKHVFSRIRPPYPLTPDEILQTAFAELANLRYTEEDIPRIQKAWLRFLTSLQHLCGFWTDDIRGDDIDLGEWKISDATPDEVNKDFIWPPAGCCEFMIDHRRVAGEDSGPVVGFFTGFWSANAVKEATETFRRAAASIAKSVKLVAPAKTVNETEEPLHSATDHDLGESNDQVDELDPEGPAVTEPTPDEAIADSGAELDEWPEKVGVDALSGFAYMDWTPWGWGIRLFSACAEAFFETPERLKMKRDGMEPRMKNAVDLLIEADAQTHPAIALSLSFSAIEALVCKKTTDITEELSGNVATLLEPNRHGRKEAIDFVKGLYKRRSNALHGTSLETGGGAEQVRRLAAAVLHAVVEWQVYQRRMVDSRERKSFVDELEAAKIAGQQMVGVPEDLAQFVKGR